MTLAYEKSCNLAYPEMPPLLVISFVIVAVVGLLWLSKIAYWELRKPYDEEFKKAQEGPLEDVCVYDEDADEWRSERRPRQGPLTAKFPEYEPHHYDAVPDENAHWERGSYPKVFPSILPAHHGETIEQREAAIRTRDAGKPHVRCPHCNGSFIEGYSICPHCMRRL